jgi:poly(3-hydroxybutyrate) depolymerase
MWEPYLGPAESVFVVAEQRTFKHRETSTLTALIDQLIEGYCIDPRRIHAMGQSGSTFTVGLLACAASERIASFSAGLGAFQPVGCTQQRPVPLMATTGDPDRGTFHRYVELWAEAYECSSDPIVEDLGSGVTRTAHQGCLADIVLYDVEGVGHGIFLQECLRSGFDSCFENEAFDLLREAELFFAEHPLPAAE